MGDELKLPNLDGLTVIMVPDDNAEASKRMNIPVAVLARLGKDDVILSNDSRRAYVREAMYQRIRDATIPVVVR